MNTSMGANDRRWEGLRKGGDMGMSYVEKKNISLNDELRIAFDVIGRMKKNGLTEYSINPVDLDFTSDAPDKLGRLLDKVKSEFDVASEKIAKVGTAQDEYELSFTINEFTTTEELLLYLIVYLFTVARGFDCQLGDWGAMIGSKSKYDLAGMDADEKMKEGYSAFETGKNYGAFVCFYLISKKIKSAEAHYNLGCIKHNLGMIRDAIRNYDEAISLDGANKTPRMNRGVAYYDSGEYQKAIDDYNIVLTQFPDEPDPYLNIANAYAQLKMDDKAIEYYDKAIALGSDTAIEAKEYFLKRR